MRTYLENALLILLSIGVAVFIFVILMAFSNSLNEDYRYAIIGAVGSIIGGSLTLIGVRWTLKQQSRATFLVDFPKKIMGIDQLIFELKKMSSRFFKSYDMVLVNSAEYNNLLNRLKILTTDIDGATYFIISKLDTLLDDYKDEVNRVSSYTSEDGLSRPSITEESIDRIDELHKDYSNILDSIITELETHSKKLTSDYFNLKGK